MYQFLLSLATDIILVTTDSIQNTGSIKTLIKSLSGMTTEEIIEEIISSAIQLGLKILLALVIYWVGKFIIDNLYRFVQKALSRKKIDQSVNTFVLSLVRVVLMLLLIVMIIGVLGINTSSFVALFASAGVAIGMALSGTLQNFAGGVMILLFKPYKVGDFIEAQGVSGTVREIQIFNTLLATTDNKTIIIPNGKLSNETVTNYTQAGTRRVEWVFGISYGDDYQKAKELLDVYIAEDKRILSTPAPMVALSCLADSSVQITARAWVQASDYWSVLYDMNERVYSEFGKYGLSFPFPQMDVHIIGKLDN